MQPRMRDWFETSLGQFLLAQERQRCRALLPSGYYPSSLQVGQPSLNFLEQLTTDRRFFIGECAPPPTAQPHEWSSARVHCALARAAAMPFGNKTHNLIILPHTLDFCEHPHAVLREVNHVLAPQGCVVITGFNRLSLWGAMRALLHSGKRPPWHGRFHRVGQVQDWLALLGFDLVGASMFAYQPPLQSDQWRRRLSFIEQAGARWLPGLGAVYIVVGRKEEIAITPRQRVQPKWQRLMMPGVAQPTARRALKAAAQA